MSTVHVQPTLLVHPPQKAGAMGSSQTPPPALTPSARTQQLCSVTAAPGREPSAKSGCAAPFQALLLLPTGEH